jgi:Transglycosylase SLT domain
MVRRVQALPIVAAGALMLPAAAQAAERFIVVELPERGQVVVRVDQPRDVALADIDLSALGSQARVVRECREHCPEGVPVRSLDELVRELERAQNRSESDGDADTKEGSSKNSSSNGSSKNGSSNGSDDKGSSNGSSKGSSDKDSSKKGSSKRSSDSSKGSSKPRKTTPNPATSPAPSPTTAPTPAQPAPRTLPDPPSAEELSGWRVPPFLIPIYRAAAARTGVSWTVLAAVNSIETDYGRNRGVSIAGAVGWMQFMPSTWLAYATDATGDRRADPLNPADAILSAARYLQASGAAQDIEAALFAYNHADWYVRDVLERARELERLPESTVASLTELALARPPVEAKVIEHSDKGAALRAQPGALVSAPRAGRIVKMGRNERLGRYVIFADTAGNRYTIGGLASVADRHVAVGTPRSLEARTSSGKPVKQRLFANPRRPASYGSGGDRQLQRGQRPTTLQGYLVRREGLRLRDLVVKQLRPGSRVLDGTVLGQAGDEPLRLEIRPAGKHGPRIDPVPVMRQWRLLDRAAGDWAEALRGDAAPAEASLMRADSANLARRVLDDPRIEIYECGRRDVAAGLIDKRVLSTLVLLADAGLRPTVSSLQCGHGKLTSSGNVSEHFTGDAVDISAINGVPVMGNQGPGSLAEQAVRRLLLLDGELRPHQVISLMRFAAADNALAMDDHDDHIHVGFYADGGLQAPGAGAGRVGPESWEALLSGPGAVQPPTVSGKASPLATDPAKP